ncbi:MAG: DUF485 domain-containing protein [Candidatus Acidiferrales bacterium]|jgi:uncharacterized membrane protein (DUF485 family)
MPTLPGSEPHVPSANASVWNRVAQTDDFKKLLAAKKAFVVPATIFFVLYYFALPISVGYFPAFVQRKVWGPVNIAYLFALSQFIVAWVIAYLYVRAARGFDSRAAAVIKDLGNLEAKGN